MRDLLLFAIILGSIPLILYRPWLGILAWYWVGIMNPHRLTWGFMYDFQVAMLIGVVALIALAIARDRQAPPVTKESTLVVLMAGYFTFTTFFAWAPDAAWNYWDQPMKIFLMTIVTTMLIYGRHRVEWLVIIIVGSLAFYGLKGGVFTILTGGQYHVLGPPRSFIQGNTSLGLAMLMVLPLMLVLARQATQMRLSCFPDKRWVRWAGWGGYVTFWLTSIATVFTYSRGAQLGLLAIGPFVFAKMRYKSVMVALGLVAGGTILALVPEQLIDRFHTIQTYEEDWSAMQRIQAWGVNWNVAVDSPWTGAGFSMVSMPTELWLSYANFQGPWHPHARVAHSNYFQVLGHHGFPGLFLYVALLISVMVSLFRLARRAKLHAHTVWISEYAWAAFVGVIGYAVAGAFLDLAYFDLFYAFVALAIILRREFAWEMAKAPAAKRAPATVGARSVPSRGGLQPARE
ncbi:putative O-glycosylation ligase, exosortase A system-associated [Aquisalimonas sp. APHAB1-3]|uniref:putative O-glycosylation ligase, exosortase A system-associated n=1 Tax=Aquisalimonas sp. APHAB1-3 TaxID=3402080 RepID=UPI003AADDC95